MHRPTAMTATAAAARATMPVVVVRSSTPPRIGNGADERSRLGTQAAGAARPIPGAAPGGAPGTGVLAREQRGVGLLVVVGRLLARHGADGHGDLHRGPRRRRLAEWDVDLRRLAGRGLVDRLADLDRLAGAGDRHRH